VPALWFISNLNETFIFPFVIFFGISLFLWGSQKFLTLFLWVILFVTLFSSGFSQEIFAGFSLFNLTLGVFLIFLFFLNFRTNKTNFKGFPWFSFIVFAFGFLLLMDNFYFILSRLHISTLDNNSSLVSFLAILLIGFLFFKKGSKFPGLLLVLLPVLFITLNISGIFSSLYETFQTTITSFNSFLITLQTFFAGAIYFAVLFVIGILSFKFGGKFLDKLLGGLLIIVSLTFLTFIAIYLPVSYTDVPSGGTFEFSRYLFLFVVGLVFLLEGTSIGGVDVGAISRGTYSGLSSEASKIDKTKTWWGGKKTSGVFMKSKNAEFKKSSVPKGFLFNLIRKKQVASRLAEREEKNIRRKMEQTVGLIREIEKRLPQLHQQSDELTQNLNSLNGEISELKRMGNASGSGLGELIKEKLELEKTIRGIMKSIQEHQQKLSELKAIFHREEEARRAESESEAP